jgi:hypothetical protein
MVLQRCSEQGAVPLGNQDHYQGTSLIDWTTWVGHVQVVACRFSWGVEFLDFQAVGGCGLGNVRSNLTVFIEFCLSMVLETRSYYHLQSGNASYTVLSHFH